MEERASVQTKEAINDNASVCVKCGLCLPHCPTYQLTQNENDSPRGRISILQALANDQISYSKKIDDHLSQCLTCRACERVCPSNVPYGELIDQGRTFQQELRVQYDISPSWTSKFNEGIMPNKFLLNSMHWGLFLAQNLGLRKLARFVDTVAPNTLTYLNSYLPTLSRPKPFKRYYGPIGEEKGQVALFLGCINRIADVTTLNSTLFVLRKLGYGVHIPKEQGCCGAIFSHNGKAKEARALETQNKEAFNKQSLKAIISTATGCSVQLKSYDSDVPYQDILEFLESNLPETIELSPIDAKVLVQVPCTLRNIIKRPQIPFDLLSKIPGLSIEPLSRSPDCCGAAGTNFIEKKEISRQLLDNILPKPDDIQADFIASSNIGCAMHIGRLIKSRPQSITICHPITLFAQSLGFLP